jgi:hypothetical protein
MVLLLGRFLLMWDVGGGGRGDIKRDGSGRWYWILRRRGILNFCIIKRKRGEEIKCSSVNANLMYIWRTIPLGYLEKVNASGNGRFVEKTKADAGGVR